MAYPHDEASAIRGVMIQKQEALGLIKRKMVELEGDLSRFAAAHFPHNHNLLPNEILSRIFVLAVQDYGTVAFPMSTDHDPPQLTVSHVCSHWRMVAFRTSELWSNTSLTYKKNNSQIVHLHQRWLTRAGTLPVTLSVKFDGSSYFSESEIASALKKILLPFRVKRLLLSMSYGRFIGLWEFPEIVLSRVTDVELDLTVYSGEADISMSSPHHFITRLRSVMLRGNDMARCLNKLSLNLPWSQLRCLEFYRDVEDLQIVVDILRKIPLLQRLVLTVCRSNIDTPEELTMPSLEDFILVEANGNGTELDKILHSFALPSLMKISLQTYGLWTSETFEILKRQYNLQGLQEVRFIGGFMLPVSYILCNSPILQLLSLGRDAIIDDEAITGISSGTLGKCLKRLEFRAACKRDVEEMLGMAEARKRTADRLIANGCTGKEEITILSYMEIDWHDGDKYIKRVEALMEAGIKILFV